MDAIARLQLPQQARHRRLPAKGKIRAQLRASIQSAKVMALTRSIARPVLLAMTASSQPAGRRPTRDGDSRGCQTDCLPCRCPIGSTTSKGPRPVAARHGSATLPADGLWRRPRSRKSQIATESIGGVREPRLVNAWRASRTRYEDTLGLCVKFLWMPAVLQGNF